MILTNSDILLDAYFMLGPATRSYLPQADVHVKSPYRTSFKTPFKNQSGSLIPSPGSSALKLSSVSEVDTYADFSERKISRLSSTLSQKAEENDQLATGK